MYSQNRLTIIIYIILFSISGFANEVLLLDDFNDGSMINYFGGLGGSFQSLPPENLTTGTCFARIYNHDFKNVRGKNRFSLELTYDVSNPNSFSGYFSKLEELDLAKYKYLSFWVKGTIGKELFKIELKNISNDVDRNKASVYINDYLDNGVSLQWQKVVIPLDAFVNLEYDLYSIKEMYIIFDLKIILKTIGVVLFGQGAR